MISVRGLLSCCRRKWDLARCLSVSAGSVGYIGGHSTNILNCETGNRDTRTCIRQGACGAERRGTDVCLWRPSIAKRINGRGDASTATRHCETRPVPGLLLPSGKSRPTAVLSLKNTIPLKNTVRRLAPIWGVVFVTAKCPIREQVRDLQNRGVPLRKLP